MSSETVLVYAVDKPHHQMPICIQPKSDLQQHHQLGSTTTVPDMRLCNQCRVIFDTPNDLIYHQLSTHPTAFCVLCQKMLSTKSKWKRHVNSVHGFGQIYKCPFCDKSGHREDIIYNHVWNTHKVLPCRECKGTFPSRDELDEHKASAHGYPPSKWTTVKPR